MITGTLLLNLFQFNDNANRKMIEKIKDLPDKTEAVKLMSHLINCQFKWMERVKGNPNSHELSWWEPLYSPDQMPEAWEKSLKPWIEYLENTPDEILAKEVQFTGYDGGPWAATPGDIALQLNLHSVHHRAQIQTMIRQQGLKPDFIDYIASKYRKL